ncbi:MAG: PAS/PAC sensor-containing diguanylate [Geobacteraceae bacterium]|nr:MAG: PAS/PAC sensor-containing diguanylate [Geobacteraceae bacterium]
MRGGVHRYAAQARPQIDTARAKKDRFRMETKYDLIFVVSCVPILGITMNRDKKIPLMIASTYLFIGAGWIYCSDKWVSMIAPTPALITWMGTVKGWCYVAVTALMLYGLMWVHFRKLYAARDELERQKQELEAMLQEQRKAVARIVEEKSKSEAIIAGIGDGITIQDTDFKIIYQNQICKDILGDHVGEYCYSGYREMEEICDGCPMRLSFMDGNIHKAERSIVADDAPRHLEITVSPMRDAEGKIVSGLSLVRDITERKYWEEEIRTTQEFLANLMDLAPMPIYAVQSNGCYQLVNRAWEKYTGISRDVAIGTPIDQLFPEETTRLFNQTSRRVIDEAAPLTIEENLDLPGGRHYFHTLLFPLRDITGTVAAVGGISIDITERKCFEEQLAYQATHDFLTGLPNRNQLHDHLEQALAYEYHHKGSLAVLLLDLDNFKVINDTFGHPSGDLLLKDVAEKLKHELRQYDTVSRLGGDEFVILISDTDRNLDIGRIAARILDIFNTPIEIKEQEVFVTASIGISIYPADGENADILLKNADAAMFHAKKKGKNNYQFFTEAINTDVHERLAMETRLRRALEREEFFLHYQPRVEMSSGRIIGMEALLRWQPEAGRIVPPAEFIPLLEDTGLIVPVEEWVMRTACTQNKIWQEAGLPALRVATNISTRHFSQENLPDKVAQILYETALEPQYLEIELTESIIMKDIAESIRKLDCLKEMGVTLSIDDFGTGYSSLSYLKRFPIDVLKIDRSFIDGIPGDSNDATISTTIIAMAHNLRMTVVAEGVETEDQLLFLTQNRCDEFQGFYFSKPLSVEDFTSLIQKEEKAPLRSGKISSMR